MYTFGTVIAHTLHVLHIRVAAQCIYHLYLCFLDDAKMIISWLRPKHQAHKCLTMAPKRAPKQTDELGYM
jgi:hypothetical protein